MFCDGFQCDYGFDVPIHGQRQTLVACGYDQNCYISTAKIEPSPYVTKALIEAKIGGEIKLIEACDDQVPPSGDFNDSKVQAVYNSVIQSVVTEINGYLSSIYPIPLVQTNTVAILKITGVDSTGLVTDFEIIYGGNYLTAPDTDNFPAYLRYLDPMANEHWLGCNWQIVPRGTGLELTVAYEDVSFSDEDGQVIQAQTINPTPIIADGGSGYRVGDILVLTGGTSIVPARIREAALDLVCHTLHKRRLAPDEKNPFSNLAAMWRKMLMEIGEGEKELDGTFKRFFSIGAMWGTRSVCNDNSL